MSPDRIGKVGDVVLLGDERGKGVPQEAVIVGHTTGGAPEFIPRSAFSSQDEVERYLGPQHGRRLYQMALTLGIIETSTN